MPGLKVLKPQETLVLTLFGKYVGTRKGEGVCFVNPFCISVNPACKTKLNQSGDVNNMSNLGNLAAVMLQRKQASAMIDARKMIVDGAVGMVDSGKKQVPLGLSPKLDIS